MSMQIINSKKNTHGLPLRPSFFPSIPVTPESVKYYETQAKEMLESTLSRLQKETLNGGMDDSWRNIGDRNGFNRYTKTNGKTNHIRIRGVLSESLPNVMSVLYTNNDEELLERRQRIYGDGLDAQTLGVFIDRPSGSPNTQLSIRWEAITTYTRYDMCVLEYIGVTVDAEGDCIGFKVSNSINIAECRSMFQSHRLIRLPTVEIMLLVPFRNRNATEILIDRSFTVNLKVTPWVTDVFTATLTSCLSKISSFIHDRAVTNLPLLHPSLWVDAKIRKACTVCHKKFGVFGKKFHCQACGEVTCKSCISTPIEGNPTKFCKKCIVQACQHKEIKLPEQKKAKRRNHRSHNKRTRVNSTGTITDDNSSITEEQIVDDIAPSLYSISALDCSYSSLIGKYQEFKTSSYNPSLVSTDFQDSQTNDGGKNDASQSNEFKAESTSTPQLENSRSLGMIDFSLLDNSLTADDSDFDYPFEVGATPGSLLYLDQLRHGSAAHQKNVDLELESIRNTPTSNIQQKPRKTRNRSKRILDEENIARSQHDPFQESDVYDSIQHQRYLLQEMLNAGRLSFNKR